uniref:Uncharacterized protein n=1 Tax=Candidatus Kentrum sp. SD TaxID=2126332 RepID=A0A450Z6J8_9GAMM|nr:MAG: hypothetical protein BECKSD772F_GA0070984_11645 [Candidatus Kentron sp. SD]VFK49421.1 MAG: hypothetical protein BECKSD772E_GA0070983_11784 [Candidatus Kentron sp. SD]
MKPFHLARQTGTFLARLVHDFMEDRCFQSAGALAYVSLLALVVGKGEAKATPSPLSQWGQFPIFTGVRLSRTGRLPGDSPSRGTIIATYTHG